MYRKHLRMSSADLSHH